MKRPTRPAKLVRADGTEQEITPANGRDFQCEELYQLLDTDTIGVVYLENGDLMLLDDNGKCQEPEKPRNDLATVIADNIGSDDYIVGDVVVCDNSQLR